MCSKITERSSFHFREAKIPCVILHGKCRAGDYEVGDRVEGDTVWNAVFIAGSWRLIHPRWAFEHMVGRTTPGYVKMETDGKKTREKVDKSEGKMIASRESFYFLTDPEHFIHFCRPAEDLEGWQLIKAPLSEDRFTKLPFVRPEFYKRKFFFNRSQANTLEAKKGACTLIIKTSPSTWRGQLSYMLYFKGDVDAISEQSDNAFGRFVILSYRNSQNEIEFSMRFPTEGIYRLRLFNKTKLKLIWICDFKIVCEQPWHNCDPLPFLPAIGWGPGEETRRSGIVALSHCDGIVKAKEDEKVEICFKLKFQIQISVRLKHSHKPDSELLRCVTKRQHGDSVKIQVNPPDADLYGLKIDANRGNMASKNVLNYIITPPRTKAITKPLYQVIITVLVFATSHGSTH